jgi:hypothetical protein
LLDVRQDRGLRLVQPSAPAGREAAVHESQQAQPVLSADAQPLPQLQDGLADLVVGL